MKNIPTFVQTFLLAIVFIFNLYQQANAQSKQTWTLNKLFQVNINKTINPASLSHLRQAIKKIKDTPNAGLIIKINTPGGLVSVTKSMITEIGEARIPFIAIVGPEGASATSAGAILSAASHFLLMFPGTNIGAATPITMQKDMPKDSRDKAINDLVALVSSLRQARKKVDGPFKKMVSEAKSYGAKEAIELKIADQIISDTKDIKSILNQKKFIIDNREVILDIKNLSIEVVKMDLGQKVLNFLASPELAYLLFLLGAALIYFELQAPGGFISGGLGVICLLLAAISFQVIPLNMGGLGLILLSFALFFMEIYIASFGLLSIAGLISLVTGSLFLFRTNDAYFELSKAIIFSTTGAIVSFMGIVFYIFLRTKKQMSVNFNDQTPTQATILKKDGQKSKLYLYQIKVKGEIWRASSAFELNEGETVAIIKKDEDNMAYQIEPIKID